MSNITVCDNYINGKFIGTKVRQSAHLFSLSCPSHPGLSLLTEAHVCQATVTKF
jgi:hypothetical protein